MPKKYNRAKGSTNKKEDQQSAPATKKEEVAGNSLSMLRLNDPNSLGHVKRDLKLYCGEKFGDLASILDTDKYPVYPDIVIDRSKMKPVQTDEILSNLYVKTIERKITVREDRIAKLEDDKPKMFSVFMRVLSKESEEKLCQDPTWNTVNTEKNPLALWKLMKKTHSGGATGTDVIDKSVARSRFVRLKMRSGEALIDFKRRFDDCVDGLIATGAGALTDEESAWEFINKLDTSAYGELIAQIMNGQTMGTNQKGLTNLNEAYTVASRYVRVERRAGGGNNANQHPVAFVATAGSAKFGSNAGKNKNKKKDGKQNNDQKDQNKKKCTCDYCGGTGHISRNCEELKTILDRNRSKREEANNVVTMTVCEVPAEPICCAFVDSIYANAETMEGVTENHVLFDTCASASLFHNEELLAHVHQVEGEATFRGVSGAKLRTQRIGYVPHFGIWAWIHPDASANILSVAAVEQKCKIKYFQGNKYEVRTPSNRQFNFVRAKVTENSSDRGGYIYACDLSELLEEDDASRNVVYKVEHHEDSVQELSTVATRRSQFTQDQIKKADEAKLMLRRIGFASGKDLREMLRNGSILDCPVTIRDLERAEYIYGKDAFALQGKTVERTASKIVEHEVPKLENREVDVFMDIMFVASQPFLLTYSHPLGLLMVAHLVTEKDTQMIHVELVRMIDHYTSEGYKVRVIHCDGEKGFGAIQSEINAKGIRFNQCGPGQHVPQIERKIRQVKERVRAVLFSLPYLLPQILLKYLVIYCVQMINVVPTSIRGDKLCPREAFYGRKVSYPKELRLGFGEYVHATRPNIVAKNDVGTSRTEACIALFPMGNVQGSYRLYNLYTGSVVTRDKWQVLPIDQFVIQQLDNLSRRDKHPVSKDPAFRQGFARREVAGGNAPIVPDDGDEGGGGAAPAVAVPPPVIAAATPPAVVVEQPVAIPPDIQLTEDVIVAPGNDGVDDVNDDGDDSSLDQRGGEQTNSSVIVVPTSGHDDVDTAVDDVPHVNFEDDDDDDPNPDPPSRDTIVIDDGNRDQESRGQVSLESDRVVSSSSDTVNEPVTVQTDYSVSSDVSNEVRTSRYGRAIKAPQRYDAFSTFSKDSLSYFVVDGTHICCNMSVKKAMKTLKDKAVSVMVLELDQMLVKEVFHPVEFAKLSNQEKKKLIRSSMFLKEKFLANGDFDKLKARLVAGGDRQDKSLYDDISSPTVTLSSILMIAAIAAKEHRHVVVTDIGGAYLNAKLKAKVYMLIDALLATILCYLKPEYKDYLLPNGSLVVQLDKALYGCVESAKLWYDHLSGSLINLGFVANRVDQCVFNKLENGVQCTVCIYVDDLFITCTDKTVIDKVIYDLREVYKEVKAHEGPIYSYLGMNFDYSKVGEVKITMDGYIEDVLKVYEVQGVASTPALPSLFEIDQGLPQLSQEMKTEFHSRVAKLFYLAKRTRPEILPTCVFLASRVQVATDEDWNKLDRCLKYLNGEPHLGIVLKPSASEDLELKSYIDASYGVHADGKSHSGAMIALGEGPIFVKSAKQKLVSKSSTEAELIALSDNASQVIWSKEFLEEQGHQLKIPIIFQDNKSTMVMAKKGKSTSERTRHINVRYFFIKDRMDKGELSVEYMPTELMIADGLTKPLQGKMFRDMRKRLLNWEY